MSKPIRHGPRVSVLVPTYRAGAYLVELCASLADQTVTDFEVLILSDGGDDHLQPGLGAFATDPRFRILSWSPNQGVARATARLLSEARGVFWCNPGADDLLHPEFLAQRLALAAHLPEATAVIFGAGIQIDAKGAEVWHKPMRQVTQRLAAFDGLVIEPRRLLRMLLQENVVNTPSVFCRTGATRPILLRTPIDWRYAQDYHYWIVLAAAGGGFGYDARPLHSYRLHSAQLTSDVAYEGLRLAEMRLVPLVALSEAATLSAVGAGLWREWRDDLYGMWLLRAASLVRTGRLDWAWQARAAQAYRGRPAGRIRSLLDFGRRLPGALRLHRAEWERARRQIWTNGLRKVDDPIFRDSHEG